VVMTIRCSADLNVSLHDCMLHCCSVVLMQVVEGEEEGTSWVLTDANMLSALTDGLVSVSEKHAFYSNSAAAKRCSV
jgi:hypothetical protein